MPDDEKMPEGLSPSDLARWLASRPRHKKPGTCVICGKPFEGTARRKYCSVKCASAAGYQVQKVRRQEQRKAKKGE